MRTEKHVPLLWSAVKPHPETGQACWPHDINVNHPYMNDLGLLWPFTVNDTYICLSILHKDEYLH